MENLNEMILELEATVATEKFARSYDRITEVLGAKMANLVLVLAEGVRASDLGVTMRTNVERGDETFLTAEKSLAVLRWLRAVVIPTLAKQ